MPQPCKFFITHSWQDIEFARRLFADLTARGLEGWLDDESLQGGHRLAEEINKGLEWCDVYIPILSKAGLKSSWCWEEINAAIALYNKKARQGRPRIISVLIEDCEDELPAILGARLYFNFTNDYNAALNDLLTKGFGVTPKPPPQSVPPASPVQKPQSISPKQPAIPRTWLVAGGGVLGVLVLGMLFAWIAARFGGTIPGIPTLGIGSTKVTAIGTTMVFVPSGEFLMGSSNADTQANANEMPQHKVYLDAYWIDQYEVTNAQYKKCVDDSKCAAPSHWTNGIIPAGKEFHPVVYVSWNHVNTYIQWLNQKTWKTYRLPTEAEWEKVASWDAAKQVKRIYPWGDTFDKTLLNSLEGGKGDTTSVGSYASGTSFYGVMDMAGNVWEWTSDWYDSNYYKNSPARNPQGPTSAQLRVLRGGSWGHNGIFARCVARSHDHPSFRDGYVGFRVAESSSAFGSVF